MSIGKPLGLDVPGVIGNFATGFQEEPNQWEAITGAPLRSTQEIESYKFLDELNAWGWWDDKPGIPEATLNKWSYELKNRPYGANWTVKDHEVRLDKTDQIMRRARGMGASVQHWKNDQLATTIEGATAVTMYDGDYFFGSTHGGAFDNLGSGALSLSTLEAAFIVMRKFKGLSGKRLGVRPNTVLVPPGQEPNIRRILMDFSPATASELRVLTGISYLVLDGLTDDNAWYLLDLSRETRPFFAQELLPLRGPFSSEGPQSDKWIQSRDYTFSADGEMAFGLSLPFLAYKSTGV